MRARERAAKLVAKIEAAIERGQFVPFLSYLRDDLDGYGPCGCAIAAAAYTAGATQAAVSSVGSTHLWLRKHHVLSRQESRALEAGYEDTVRTRGPFYRAGVELRKFNPRFTEAS